LHVVAVKVTKFCFIRTIDHQITLILDCVNGARREWAYWRICSGYQ